MPVKKSAIKALKQSKKKYLANKKVKDALYFLIKKSRKEITAKSGSAKEWVAKTIKTLDKAAQKNIIKKNTAARKKSRLIKALNAVLKK